jgi:hypothetical protein
MFHSSIRTFSAASAVSEVVRERHGDRSRTIHRGLTKRELQRLRRLSCLCDMFAIVDSRGPSPAAGGHA